MSLGWGVLPLLPLRCVLEHLSLEDALSALSVCRHWRSAILLYEGRKETLKLRAKQLDRNLHLARVFRKHTKRLHIYIDCSSEELDKFLTYVLPQFFDTLDLQEILFIGPNYAQLSLNTSSVVKLNRILTESLIFKHLHSIRSLALLGCQMDVAKNENVRFMNKSTEYYSRPLSFNNVASPADAILSQCNVNLMTYSALQHIILDYEQVSTKALETLSHLAQFSLLSLNIGNKRQQVLLPIDWRRVQALYSNGLEVAVNIIGVNQKKLNDIIDNVLVEDMMLVSLKVMFCKTFYGALIAHVVSLYDDTLRELVWADSPCDSTRREIPSSTWYEGCAMNPLIVLCWRCKQLRRVVVHGYWIWQYDVVGIVRLRKRLEDLEISAIYNKQSRFNSSQSEPGCAVRVLSLDHPKTVDDGFVQQLNQYTEFKWRPTRWQHLHPALRARATAEQRAGYVLAEVTRHPPKATYEE